MKNKRKYENAPSTLATDVTKRNLSKLRKLAKTDNPLVAEIKTKASDFLSDRKNANCLIDIIGHLDNSEPSSVACAAIQAMKRIVTALAQKNQIKRPGEPKDDESTELKYRRWLWERIEDALRKITELMFHRKTAVSHLAVVTLMNIIQIQNFSIEKPRGWDHEGHKILNLIVLSFCSNKNPAKVPLGRFQEYFEYGDVCCHMVNLMSKVVHKVAKKEKASPVFVDNVINCLEMLQLPDKDKLNTMARFIPAAVSEDAPKLSHEQLKSCYGTIWTSLVVCKFNVDQYKRSLILLNEKVIPQLPRPVLLTDFLLGCFSVGGAISMLALSGVFTLMTKYNLEYPDFYKKLYELFRVEIFHVKYKARFFHLSDLFLASTHLPETMVASFVKRLARISLQAPAECLPLCIRFIHNLIHRHRGLEILIDSPERSDLTTDPFLASEADPSKTRALESSLWEVKTLTSHVLPEVSSAAKDLLEKGIREQEKDISAVLEHTATDNMELELKKKVFVNVPLNWEKPVGLKFAKDDFVSEIFDFV